MAPRPSIRHAPTVHGAWETLFPWGVVVDNNTINQNTLASAMVTDGAVGLDFNNLREILWLNSSPWHHEVKADAAENGRIIQTLDALNKGLSHVIGPTGAITGTAQADGPSLFGTYYAGPGPFTDAAAAFYTDQIEAIYRRFASVIGYCVGDDCGPGAPVFTDTKVATAIRAIQRRDQRGRFASTPYIDAGSPATAAPDLQVIFTEDYGKGYTIPDVACAEGDFHTATFQNWFGASGSLTHGNGDFTDYLRYFRSNLAANVRIWGLGQVHQTTHGNNSALIYPTAKEITAMSWQLIGEDRKGILWFTWNTPGNNEWVGLQNAASSARLAAVKAIGLRLNANIRRTLLRTTRVADRFTVVGGGYAPNGYSNAYIVTHQDEAGRLYAIVCQYHPSSSQTMTVSGSGLSGTMTSLETSATTQTFTLGGTNALTLAALDGSIYRLDP